MTKILSLMLCFPFFAGGQFSDWRFSIEVTPAVTMMEKSGITRYTRMVIDNSGQSREVLFTKEEWSNASSGLSVIPMVNLRLAPNKEIQLGLGIARHGYAYRLSYEIRPNTYNLYPLEIDEIRRVAAVTTLEIPVLTRYAFGKQNEFSLSGGAFYHVRLGNHGVEEWLTATRTNFRNEFAFSLPKGFLSLVLSMEIISPLTDRERFFIGPIIHYNIGTINVPFAFDRSSGQILLPDEDRRFWSVGLKVGLLMSSSKEAAGPERPKS